MLRPRSLLCALTALSALALSAPAFAAPVLAINLDNTGAASGSSDTMIGWRFSTASPITVSQLGFWDQNGNGLVNEHQVGIWTTSGSGAEAAALVSTTVLSGTADPLA